MLAPQRGRDGQETPHPTSSLGHPLPKGEGKNPRAGAPKNYSPLRGERVAAMRRRVRGLFQHWGEMVSGGRMVSGRLVREIGVRGRLVSGTILFSTKK